MKKWEEIFACSFVNTDDIDIIESANYFQDALLSEHEYIVWTDPFKE